MRPSAFASSPDGIAYEAKQRHDLQADYRSDIDSMRFINGPVPPKPQDRASVRVLQWNINKLKGVYSTSNQTKDCHLEPEASDVAAQILNFDADIIVLQECGTERDDIFDIRGRDEHIGKLGRLLFESGYRLLPAGVHCPTVLATRLPYTSLETVPLDHGFRGAGCFSAAYVALRCFDDTPLIAYGTHLNHRNTGPFYAGQTCRLDEIKELLRHYHMRDDPRAPVLIVADFNQQRRQDYLPARKFVEKDSIDDGVNSHLTALGFHCCLDAHSARRNWQGDLPPFTHWSGTVIDYAFGRNIYPIGVYIASLAISDHVPVVSDWVIRTPFQQRKSLQLCGCDRIIGRILMCAFVVVGCTLVLEWRRGRR